MQSIPQFFLHNIFLRSKIYSLQLENIINHQQKQTILEHFNLTPHISLWKLFLERTLSSVGSLLLVFGMIFFFAYNWDSMSKFHKFGLVQAVLLLFTALSLWKWNSWVKEVLLTGIALSIGAAFALFGQIYQTGADAWELFRIWTICLLPMALISPKPALFFMMWITASLWGTLYIVIEHDSYTYSLDMVVMQLVFWIIYEGTTFILEKKNIIANPLRWLPRLVGGAAFCFATTYIISEVIINNIGARYNELLYPVILPYFVQNLAIPGYIGVLGLMLFVYAKKQPDMFFISIGVFGAISTIVSKLIVSLIDNNFDIGRLLLIGVIVIGASILAFAIIIKMRRRIHADLEAANDHNLAHTRQENTRKNLYKALEEYTYTLTDIETEQVETFFAKQKEADEHAAPWYISIPLTIGIWIGVLIVSVFIVIQNASIVGPVSFIAGLYLCHHSNHLLRKTGFSLVIIGLCSIMFVATETYHIQFWGNQFNILLGTLLGIIWIFMPGATAKAASAAGFGFCLLCIISDNAWFASHRYYDDEPVHSFLNAGLYPAAIFTAGCLSLGLLILRNVIGKWQNTPASGIFNPLMQTQSFSWGMVILCAGLAFASIFDNIALQISSLGIPLGILVMACGMWIKKDMPAALIITGAIALSTIAFFQPAIAMGFTLYLLGFSFGNAIMTGTASVYMGATIVWYYYSMDIPLLDKSFVLMGSGALLIAMAFGVNRILKLLIYSSTQGGSHA